VDVLLRNVRLASNAGEEGTGEEAPNELLLSNAHVQLEVIAGAPDDDGGRPLEGFYLVVTETTPEGEPAPDAMRVRIPAQPNMMRLLASSVLDYLEQNEAKGSDLTIASAGEVAQLGQLNRAERRRRERGR
jgi:hypothetical protein